MVYPPVPYPPVLAGSGAARQQEVDQQWQARETQSTPKKIKTLHTPFKSPLPPRRSAPPAAKRARRDTSPSSTSVTASPATPRAAVKPAVKALFKPPSFTSSASTYDGSAIGSSPAVELTLLESRLKLLRQAREYQREDEMGLPGNELEIKALSEKWKEAGRTVAELLFNHPLFPQPTLTASSKSTYASDAPRLSSPEIDDFYPSRTLTTSEFLAQVDASATRQGLTRSEVMEEMEKDCEYLPTLDEIQEKAKARNAGKTVEKVETSKKVIPGFIDESWLDDFSDKDEGSSDEAELCEVDEIEWDLGTMLESMGVNPRLFGLQEEE